MVVNAESALMPPAVPECIGANVIRNHSGFGGPTRDISRRHTSGLTKPKDRTSGMARSTVRAIPGKSRGKLADHEMLTRRELRLGCENHRDRPGKARERINAAERGMPCPPSNAPDAGEAPPPMPKGFRTDADKRGWRH